MSTSIKKPLIMPFLWFDNNAQEAVDFYTAIFPNSRILTTLPNHPDITPSPSKILTITFELDGIPFTALNGGPEHKFNPAVSFAIHCDNQQEIDRYWAALTADGGSEVACGWLTDKFGLSWQVVPTNIGQLVRHPKAMQALMPMKKIHLATLEHAAHG